jgi:hypothetical protein
MIGSMSTTLAIRCRCHCYRCRRPNPAPGGELPFDWEPLVDDDLTTLGVLCPGCITGEQRQAMVSATSETYAEE